MIRGTLCVILVVLSLAIAIPQPSSNSVYAPAHKADSQPLLAGHDPNGTLVAFNASRAQFDLYTERNATWVGGSPPTWYSGNFTNTQSGTSVLGTTFNVTIASGAPATKENVTWDKVLNVPKGNVSSTTYLRFDWRGSTGNFTKASYFVYNETDKAPIFSDTKVNQTSIGGGPPSFNGGSPPVGCGPTDNCFDVSRYTGFNLTLTFAFNTTASGKGLTVRVSNVAVVSADDSPIHAYSHSMGLSPTDSTKINHNSDLTFGYFANVTYRKPNAASGSLNHTWSQMIVTYYYPNSYGQVSIVQNGTSLLPANPIAQGNCPAFFFCTSTHFISLNMTAGIKRAGINIAATSVNVGAGVQTTLGGIPTTSWGQGDLLQVRVDFNQGVNITGSDFVSANKTGVVRVTQTFDNVREQTSLLNFTTPLPQDITLLGAWTVNSTFTNGYDYGYTSTSFTLQQLGVTAFAYSGSNQRLIAGGTLMYASSTSPAPNVNGYVFAIDAGSTTTPTLYSTTTNTTSGDGMYVSNITLVNGVFTTGQHLVMTFTLVNPTFGLSNPVGFSANLTIDHEFASKTTHGSSATVQLLNDAPFTLQSKYVYTLNATLTPAGIDIIVKSYSSGFPISTTLPTGNPPVTSLRQQAGLFKLTVLSKPTSSSVLCPSGCNRTTESGAYAYVLVNPPVPGRLLSAASFTSASNGAFSAIISPATVLGANQLTFITLGLDPSGLGVTVQGQSTRESTVLLASVGSIPSVIENQQTTLALHLRSNSTILNMNITISLNLQGSGIVQTQSGISIAPGTSKDITFSFTAPSSPGAYTLTFFSTDYGAPLVAGTLQVSVLQSSLQVILPAIIGVIAAIVILLFFLFRKKPDTAAESATKDKPAVGKTKASQDSSTSKSLT